MTAGVRPSPARLYASHLKGLLLGIRSKAPFRKWFQCNICGAYNSRPYSDFNRESPSCDQCGSTVRMRAMIHHASEALYGKSLVLTEWPVHPEYRGVGLSDWDGYANRLPHRVNYTNTYYHQAPFLDITKPPAEMEHTCNFIISTDVFEHVLPPVSRAFEGAMKLLKPGGTLVMSVPFALETPETLEHYPDIHNFEIRKVGDDYELVNTLASGEVKVHRDLVFHGGPGDTLEMRVFAKEALRKNLEDAGFTDVRFRGESMKKYGIYWHYPWSVPVTAKAPG
ncbi:methyltransferase domain-containing protein [Caenimonas koreensis]|uniref:methyltransferase domain-containing protein n=1 Tax=Caenimonas koreensis TaxID=367474 RepID=UPI0037831AC9